MNKLPKEVEEGNIEYKRMLCNLSRYRITQLESQMKWRINEGNGTAIYLIGVDDDGTPFKLNSKKKKESFKNIKKIAKNINAYIESINFKNDYHEVLIKNINKNINYYEKRIAFLGESMVGKSTLISIITKNLTDDGKGSARLSLFNHKHEMFSGLTSSISIQYYDYDNSDKNKKIVLVDLPGNDKYKKTKYYGLLSFNIELVVYVIDNSTNMANINESRQICDFLEIPILFVINKTDIYDYIEIKKELSLDTIDVSCVDLTNIDLLKNKLADNSIYINKNNDYIDSSHFLLEDDIIFQINDIYYITEIGIIVSGILIAGEINKKTKMKFGPLENNAFIDINIISIHCHQIAYDSLENDHMATIVIKFKNTECDIKEILSKYSKNIYLSNYNLSIYNEVDCKITLLSHPTQLKNGHKIQLYFRNIIVECAIINIKNNDRIITNSSELCKIQFSKPCYLRNHEKIIFDDGVIKGFGFIVLV